MCKEKTGRWPTLYLNELEALARKRLQYSHRDADAEELEHRVIWEMFDLMMKLNFRIDIKKFLETMEDKYLRMLPIPVKEKFKSYQRFLLLIELESRRRSDATLNCYTKWLICLTVVLLILGAATIFVTLLPYIIGPATPK